MLALLLVRHPLQWVEAAVLQAMVRSIRRAGKPSGQGQRLVKPFVRVKIKGQGILHAAAGPLLRWGLINSRDTPTIKGVEMAVAGEVTFWLRPTPICSVYSVIRSMNYGHGHMASI